MEILSLLPSEITFKRIEEHLIIMSGNYIIVFRRKWERLVPRMLTRWKSVSILLITTYKGSKKKKNWNYIKYLLNLLYFDFAGFVIIIDYNL